MSVNSDITCIGSTIILSTEDPFVHAMTTFRCYLSMDNSTDEPLDSTTVQQLIYNADL